MHTIISAVGYPGAGKSVVSDWMRESGVTVVSMGDQLRSRFESQDKEELKDEFGISNTSSLLGKWATHQRDIHGADIVAKWAVKHIENNIDADTVFVDGIRSNEELSYFKERFESVYVIFVESSRETRLERIRNRGREDESDFTLQDLERRDSREEEWGLKDVIVNADYKIKNESSMENFKTRISMVFNDIADQD